MPSPQQRVSRQRDRPADLFHGAGISPLLALSDLRRRYRWRESEQARDREVADHLAAVRARLGVKGRTS